MRVVTIPCRTDNFSYLVGASNGDRVAVVDPCESEPILHILRTQRLQLAAILNTHHHNDHVGGNRALLQVYPDIPVYAHRSDRGRIPGQTHELDEGDTVSAAGVDYRVLFVPGHTSGHIAYVTRGAAFVGDTIFGGGCGRLFEGTPAQMNQSINRKLASLPDDTKLYFAHEYTEANLKFALAMDPNNAELLSRIEHTRELRGRGEWTTPSTLALERETNPFLRVAEESIISAVGASPQTSPDDVFAALRAAKDRF